MTKLQSASLQVINTDGACQSVTVDSAHVNANVAGSASKIAASAPAFVVLEP